MIDTFSVGWLNRKIITNRRKTKSTNEGRKNMKLSNVEFNKKVRQIRRMMPYFNNGRKVVVVGENI